MSSTVYYGKGSQTGYRFKNFAVDSPEKIENFVEGRVTASNPRTVMYINIHKIVCSPFTAAKQLVTISSNVSSSIIASNSVEGNKLSPELQEMLDFTTPYKVLVDRKSWEKHDSKSKVPVNDVPIQTNNDKDEKPQNLQEAPTSDRRVSK